MAQLNLTSDEIKALREVLDRYLKDLTFELSNTEALTYREKLREHKRTIEKISKELSASDK